MLQINRHERRIKMKTSTKKLYARGVVVASWVLLLAWNVFSQEDGRPALSQQELKRLFMEYLSGEGYRPEAKRDDIVEFKREGKWHYLVLEEKDKNFVQVILPTIWTIDSEKERLKVLEVADQVNARTKCAKVYTHKDEVWISVELFFEHREDFRRVFERAMSALDAAVGNFVKAMRE